MAENKLVRVQLKDNPNVKRTMTESSLRTNAHKWELVEGQDSKTVEKSTAKNADAGNAVAPANTPAKAPVVADPELELLRADYFEKTGKPVDKRWRANKIKTELEK